MVNLSSLAADERSRVFWLLSDCFLKTPTEIGLEVWQALQCPVDCENEIELRKEFTRLFRGIKEGYGPPPPYESLYRPSVFPTEINDAVIAYFRNAGLDVWSICLEAPDYLASELMLMSLLAYQEFENEQKGNDEQRRYFLRLQNEFLNNHLLIWVPEYCQALKKHSRIDLFRQLADYLETFLKEINDDVSATSIMV